MDCKNIEETLSGVLDKQLAKEDIAPIEQHLRNCQKCTNLFASLKNVDAILKEHLPQEHASQHLKEKVLESLRLERIETLLERGSNQRSWLRQVIPAGAAAICLLAVLLFWEQSRPINLAETAISSHIKSLSGQLTIEEFDSSPKKLERWFSGKFPFQVNVPDLSQEGYRLVGGRLCHLKGIDAAYIYFEKQGNILSLFVGECSEKRHSHGDEQGMAVSDGSTAVCWSNNHLDYVIVSNIPQVELNQISIKLRTNG